MPHLIAASSHCCCCLISLLLAASSHCCCLASLLLLIAAIQCCYLLQCCCRYTALSKERVLQRWFDCWCTKCLLATGPGCSAMNSNYQVSSCECSEPWWERSVALKGTQGIIAQKKEAQRKGREQAKKLKLGTFIAVQDRSSQGYTIPFMIGITLDTGHATCCASIIL